jgi:putative membrane protein
MHGYDMMDGWGGMWFGPVVMILGIVLIVLLVVWLVRAATSGSGVRGNGRPLSPRQVLDERYAKGEIDDEEYARRRAMLDNGRGVR